jgi:5-methylcytosine-specific restriction endonuclease McrA
MIAINLMTKAIRDTLRARRWVQSNPERARENQRAWVKRNPEKVRAAGRRYKAAHPEKQHIWEKLNPEKHNQQTKDWQKAHPERTREINRVWAQANPEKVRAKARIRRARKAGAGGFFTPEQFKALGDCCLSCKRTGAELAAVGLMLVPDHVIPLSKGGSNDISNIQPLCHGIGGCNNHKSAKHVDYRRLNA